MLLVLAAGFALVNGFNDGAAIVASGLKQRGRAVAWTVLALVVALVVVPLVLGTAVADTLTSGLVEGDAAGRPALVGLGVVAATVVAVGLSRAGLPTSLTLAVVGGIVGVAVGQGRSVRVGEVWRVVGIGVAAPLVGVAVAWLAQAAARVGRVGRDLDAGPAGVVATVALAVAYAANDGQKMLALLTVAGAGVTPASLVLVAVLFAVGTVAGAGPTARTLSSQVAATSSSDQVLARAGAAVAVLGSAGLGSPVSMTQSIAGAVVGTELSGGGQVRWNVVADLGLAWALTLPLAALVGALLGGVAAA